MDRTQQLHCYAATVEEIQPWVALGFRTMSYRMSARRKMEHDVLTSGE